MSRRQPVVPILQNTKTCKADTRLCKLALLCLLVCSTADCDKSAKPRSASLSKSGRDPCVKIYKHSESLLDSSKWGNQFGSQLSQYVSIVLGAFSLLCLTPPISSASSPSSVWRRFVNDNYGERLKIIEAGAEHVKLRFLVINTRIVLKRTFKILLEHDKHVLDWNAKLPKFLTIWEAGFVMPSSIKAWRTRLIT